MRALNRTALAALAAASAGLAAPGMALANGEDVHVGAIATGIPLGVIYGIGGFVGLLVLLFVVNWARHRRSRSRGGASSGTQGFPTQHQG